MDILQWIEDNQAQFSEMSEKIWSHAELGYTEVKSAKLLANTLEADGFAVERGIAGIPTAFVATYGKGKPVIAILGEYDALPNLSQNTVAEKSPVEAGGNGHGCGHNLLGVGSLAAAMAVKQAIDDGDTKGTVQYYGCPAEENGSGKAFMVKEGVFDGVDISITWHPGAFNGSFSMNLLANYKVRFKFYGRASHAAADPQNGRSALDAVELMNVGVNYLREHMIPDARIHYVIADGGGPAPNVVPAYAESFYLIRAPQPDQLKELFERVKKIANGAAMMTETRVEIDFIAGCSNVVYNSIIDKALLGNMNKITPPAFSDKEKAYAADLATTFPKGSSNAGMMLKLFGPEAVALFKELKGSILPEIILPPYSQDVTLPGSSDVGDVSWVTPTGQIMTTCQALGTPGHSWQLVAQSGMSIGEKGMIYAGKVMAATAVDFMQNPDMVTMAKEEFEMRLDGNPFVPIIPDGITPPIPDGID